MDSIIVNSISSIAKRVPVAKKWAKLASPAMPYVRATQCVLDKIRPNWKQTRNLRACTAIYDEIAA